MEHQKNILWQEAKTSPKGFALSVFFVSSRFRAKHNFWAFFVSMRAPYFVNLHVQV